MGMYATKHLAEESRDLDTQWLKKNGYFCGYKSGGIKWTWGYGGESSIGFTVDVLDDFPNIRLQYTVHSSREERRSMDYSLPLIKVPCNLGGFRWAFQCTLSRNNIYCGRLVYHLYKGYPDYFGCRNCIGIVYNSQRDSGKRFAILGKILDAEREAKEVLKTIHKWHYRGQPTRKVRKYYQIQNKVPPMTEAKKIFHDVFS